MHNTIIRHFSYITKEITRVRLEKGIVEIRYIQVIGLSRRSPGENPARRNQKRRGAGGNSDGVNQQSVGGRSFAPPSNFPTNGAELYVATTNRSVVAVPYLIIARFYCRNKREGRPRDQGGKRREEREMEEEENEKERDKTISATPSSALPQGGRTTTIQRRNCQRDDGYRTANATTVITLLTW